MIQIIPNMSDGNSQKKQAIITMVLFISFISGLFFAYTMDTGYGSIQVSRVNIPDGSLKLSGLLYRPITANSGDPRPGVVCVHGISGSQQTMNGIALELARRGIVTLALDLHGHGNSEGSLAFSYLQDPTIGTLSAVRYLESLPYVNQSRLGLVGHSLGGGAVRATAFAHKNISAVVTLGSHLSWSANESEYGIVNTTFPRNFLFAVGKYDELFANLTQLRTELMPVFGTGSPVVANSQIYGSFAQQNARRLVFADTIHLFEMVDPFIMSEILFWMDAALWGTTEGREGYIPYNNHIYLLREWSLLLATVSLLLLFVPISSTIFSLRQIKNSESSHIDPKRAFDGDIGAKTSGLIYGGLVILLFLPMAIIGFIIGIPPLIFGSSISWWLLAVGLGGILSINILTRFSSHEARMDFRRFFFNLESEFMSKYTAILILGYFIILYLITLLVESFLVIDFHFIVPLFNDLSPPSRIVMFLLFLPFLMIYFVSEGIIFFELSPGEDEEEITKNYRGAFQLVGIRLLPILLVLAIQYVPKFLFNILPISWGFSPLLFQFFWVMVPVFAFSTLISWWGFRTTGRIGAGALMNTLLLSWMLAAQFPFGSFG